MKNHCLLFSFIGLFLNLSFGQTIPDSLLPQIEKKDLHNIPSQQRGNAVTCGVVPNQFTIQIVSDSSYNGYELKCADACSGFYTVNVTGGIGPFTFQWLGAGNPGTQNDQSWTSVCDQSSIQVLVTDVGQGTTCAASHVLNVPDRLRTINFTLTPPSCFNTCDGAATHAPVFGVPPYNFVWTSGEFTQNANVLCIGSSTLTITDLNGCQFDTTVTITTPPPIFANVNITEVSCNNVCDGVLTSFPSGGTGVPYSFNWTNTGSGSPVSAISSATGLCENNTYNLHLTDRTGCFIDTAITLADKLPMTLTVASSSDALCFNACNGQTSINVTGGSSVYVSYDWYQGVLGSGVLQPFSGPSVNNLCAFTDYYVVVTDSDGCSDSLQIAQVNSPPSIIINETHNNNSCFGDNSGTINITASGGVSSGTYTYFWSTIDGSGLTVANQNQTGLSGGTYQVLVTDDVGCQDSISIIITEPSTIIANGVVTDVTCFNLTDGIIDLTTSGGTGGYTWNWTSTDGSFVNPGTEDLSGLDSASYTVRITDADGCFIDTTILIAKPDEIYINPTVTTILCNGDDNAQINIAPTNGTGTYVFDWDIDGTGDFDDNQNQIGLSPNTYNLSVRDNNGCQKDTSFNIVEPTPITFTSTIVQPHCGQSDGSIAVVVSGGTSTYTYSWLDASATSVGNTATASNLPAGCYDLTITDFNNCILTQQICITDLTAPTAVLTTVDASCNNVCDGAVTIAISGGTIPYTTVWTSTDVGFTDPNTDDIFLLCAADYTLTLTDGNNCIYTESVTVNEPLPINITDATTMISCNGGTDGAIDITATGGTVVGNYSYSWTGSNAYANNIEDITSLSVGSYTVVVTDDNNCSNNSTINITEPTPITYTLTTVNSQCNTNTGSITVVASGGSSNYNYSWTDALNNPVGTNSTTLSNQPSGIYNLLITDDNGCTESTTATISDDAAPTLVVDNFGDVSCNGLNDGFINVTATGGFGVLTYIWTSTPTGFTSNNEDVNLLPGNIFYNIIVSDANGCTASQSVFINEPSPIVVNSNIVDPLCNGANTGSIDISVTGGTPNYTYDWDNDGTGDFDDLEDLNNLTSGSYTINILDNKNCPHTTTLTLNDPTEISLSTSNVNSNCLQNDGSASVLATGGSPISPGTYTYQWSPVGQTTPVLGINATLTNQPAGCYDVEVSDGNNCSQVATVCITDNAAPDLAISATDVTCFGSSDGTVSLTITNGQIPYSPIVWTGNTPIPNGALNANSLQAGVYAVQVTDGAGCIATISDTVNEPLQILISGLTTNPDCNNGTNGAINVTVDNALGIITYTWTGPVGFTDPGTEDLAGLSAGQYCLTIVDGNNCTSTQCFNLNNPPAIQVTSSSTSTSCANPTGQVSSAVTGGTPNYNFNWRNSANISVGLSANINNLGADTYTLTVTDANGCTGTAQEIISMVNGPTVSLVNSNDVLCKGDATGSIVISVTGGTPNYTFDWDNLPGSNDPQNQSNLTAGNYTVIVTDAVGCSDNLLVTISEPLLALTANGIATNAACNGLSMGAIDLTVAGGTINYNYLWSNSGVTEDLNGLNAGTYSVIVTDNNGCQAFDTTEITSPTPLNLAMSSNDASCTLSNGDVSVVVTGGNLNYAYSWSDVTNGQPGTVVGGNSNAVSSLPAGSYQVLIIDGNGCSDSAIVAISNTTGPTVTSVISDVLCYGGASGAINITVIGTPNISYNWSGPLPFTGANTEDISSVEAGTYTVAVTDGNNCITNQVLTINGPTSPISDNAVVTPLNCYNDTTGGIDLSPSGGTSAYTFTWTGPNSFSSNSEDINQLLSGSYNLHIDDNNGCGYDNVIVVNQPDSIQITPNLVQPTCGVSDGSISVTIAGGTVANDYTYSWIDLLTGGNVGITNTISSLAAGNYQIIVTDDNGCSNSLIISLSDANAPPLTTVITNVDCFGNLTGAINLTVGGASTYSFDWDNDGMGDNDDLEDLANLSVGAYSVLVTDLVTGCIAATSANVTEPNALDLTANTIDLTCFNDNSGAIDITITGGTITYSFDWDNLTQPTEPEDQSGLAAGSYSVTVTDNNGCTIADVYTLTEPLAIGTSTVLNHNNCFGETQGSIDLTPTNGAIPYTYNWTSSPPFIPSLNQDLNNLVAGTYNLTITDNAGCSKDTAIIITEPPAIALDITVTDANCNVNDGAASVLVSGGVLTSPDYIYNWQNGGSSISTTNSINAVGAGSYLLSVTDDNGCQKDSLININNINAPVITFDSLHAVTCLGDLNGDIFVSIAGGVAPYTQIWNPNAVSISEDLLNVSAGTYTLTVTDAVGCISSFDTTLVSPLPIIPTITSTDATCDSCNGTAGITTTGGVGTITYLWFNNAITSSVQNLCAGVYPVMISDDNNCSITSNVIINNTGGPTGESIISNNVSCFGGNDGAVTITAIGGTAPYTYFWPHNNSISNVQNNLTAGTYLVQMKDLNGCMRTASIIITEPSKILAQSFVTSSDCNSNNGTITIVVSGGTASYNINWNGGLGTSPTLSNLSSGIYSVVITDANLCTESYSFNLPDNLAPSLTLTSSDVLCNGGNNGSVVSSVTGNTGAITYQWYSNNTLLTGQNNSSILNQEAGNYLLTILDNVTGCANQSSIVISEPDSLILALPTLTDASCSSVCDAMALVNPIGGTLGYSYLWNNGETTQMANALCVGINTVTITDNNNCSIEQTVISEANNNIMASISNTDAVCGQCDGVSTIVPSGGSGAYTLLWADGSSDLTHSNLCAGIHPFEVIDNNGCSVQFQSVISNTGGPDNETINKVDVSCYGGSNGSIIVNPSGGTQPYSYLWIPTGVTSNSINNLAAGTYYLEVTDSNRCTRVVPVEISEPELPIVDAIVTNTNCGNNDGTITVTVNGINGPYSIGWTGPNGYTSSQPYLIGLEAGVYILNLTDASGCLTTYSFSVNATNTPNLTISKTDVSCFGVCDGSAQVTALPASGNYTYNWLGQTIVTPTINSLCEGEHLVEVTDVNSGCIILQSVNIEAPDSISIEVPFVQNPTCFELCDGTSTLVVTGGALSYSYNWLTGSNTESQNNLCVGDSKVIVTDANGCMDSITIMVSEPTEIIITIDSVINSECVYSTEGAVYTSVNGGTPNYTYGWTSLPASGFTANTEDVTGLLPTNYIFTVTDANNCIKMDTIGIDTNHIVLAFAGLDTAVCIGNCATFVGNGEGPLGIMYEWFDEFGNSLTNTDSTITVCPDTARTYNYVLEVSDAFCSHRDSVDIVIWDLPEVDAGEDAIGLIGIVISIGGDPTAPAGQSYEWSPIQNILGGEETNPNPQIELNEEQDFVVVVVDTNGCINYDTVHVKPIPEVSYPNGFTPNGDGVNEYWQIDFIKEFSQSVVEVYNRWGQLLFRSVGYNEPWDGIYKGKPLPVGTYYYIIELNDPNFPNAFTGPITLMR